VLLGRDKERLVGTRERACLPDQRLVSPAACVLPAQDNRAVT